MGSVVNIPREDEQFSLIGLGLMTVGNVFLTFDDLLRAIPRKPKYQ